MKIRSSFFYISLALTFSCCSPVFLLDGDRPTQELQKEDERMRGIIDDISSMHVAEYTPYPGG